ncbi:Ni/Fe hydrogenase subunit alpha [Gimesia fumaroli]|uniref:NAD-reducing hydrogenase HoxS subunit beta n=1 Tax=Gimesia fumaroli TaxID=2527976 RepID=A0A518IFT9_9PLAN|nr:Ni/Fe hydrogenase subunit alpha [Gimesia fumaroli]QDV51940.1 NAD-reducing hydrogenase HoxS subunit beta [Gimesia fumaroli]
MADRTIKVETLTRVEGEGGLYVRLRGDAVDEVRLEIYEPPRLFEALLRGRPLEDAPDITARICGICPVAYQMSSVHALESALDVTASAEIRRLRRLLYCGEWIESHGLHMHLLHAPDFLGFDSGLDMAKQFPDEVNRGLRLKKHGNQLVDMLGGRAIHPVNVCVGGFYRMPRRDEFQKLIPDFEWGLNAAVETTRWVAGFEFPDFETECEYISLSHPDEYPMNEGFMKTSSGDSIEVSYYEDEFQERHVPHSTALQAIRKSTGRPYLLGPLARVNLNREQLSPTARQLADDVGLEPLCKNPHRAIIARGLEIVHAYEEALMIMRGDHPTGKPRESYSYQAGEGMAATEAPRGTLFHRYVIDEAGKIVKAVIIPPTSQNQAQIEADLKQWVTHVMSDDEQETARQCENLVRAYDPCISCSTHFLNVKIERT